jgi:hypothetical protein
MSIESKKRENDVQDALARLFAGREPSEAMLARCPRIEDWRLTVGRDGRDYRVVHIHGRPDSDRFRMKGSDGGGGWKLLWLDRKRRFALTVYRLWVLGAEEREVGMDWSLNDD